MEELHSNTLSTPSTPHIQGAESPKKITQATSQALQPSPSSESPKVHTVRMIEEIPRAMIGGLAKIFGLSFFGMAKDTAKIMNAIKRDEALSAEQKESLMNVFVALYISKNSKDFGPLDAAGIQQMLAMCKNFMESSSLQNAGVAEVDNLQALLCVCLSVDREQLSKVVLRGDEAVLLPSMRVMEKLASKISAKLPELNSSAKTKLMISLFDKRIDESETTFFDEVQDDILDKFAMVKEIDTENLSQKEFGQFLLFLRNLEKTEIHKPLKLPKNYKEFIFANSGPKSKYLTEMSDQKKREITLADLVEISKELVDTTVYVPIGAKLSSNAIPSAILGLKPPQQGETDLKMLPSSEQRDDFIVRGDEKTHMTITSGYPLLPGEKRFGDPIADDMQIRRYIENGQEMIVLSAADGCGWGQHPRLAAELANQGYTEKAVEAFKKGIFSSSDLTRAAMDSFAAGFGNITAGLGNITAGLGTIPKENFEGSTTQLGALLVKQPNGRAIGTFTSVGDMKAFIQKKDGSIEEITKSNRGNVDNASDCGGRLFPESIDGRNLQVYPFVAEEDETLIILSDGVHDNLDPETLGMNIQETYDLLQSDLNEAEKDMMRNLPPSWVVKTPEQIQAISELKAAFMVWKMKEIVRDKKPGQTLDEALVQYAYDTGAASRQFMEANPKDKLPNDYKLYPGKVDHISCGMIKI